MIIKGKEKGQVLIIVALLSIAFVAMLALVLDGGMAYTSRRRAQNAADAGALAGADTLCRTSNATAAQTVALDYAVTRNEATSATALADLSTSSVAVTATVQVDTFFAGLFGANTTTAVASALAGCESTCAADTVMPFAWACKAPAGVPSESPTCAMEFGTVDTPGPLYIVMDSESVNKDFNCQTPPNSGLPVNTLDCDIDNDGIDDMLANGDRSWLNLDGGASGANEQEGWINTGQSPLIQVESWLGGSTGVRDSVFAAVQNRVGDFVVIPVFNKFCDGYPDAFCAGEDLTDPIVNASGTSTLYFHVVALAAFRITCVADAPNDSHCPGHNAMDAVNPGLPTSLRTIEGYFIRGYVPGMRACTGSNPYYTGAFTVHLQP